MSITKISKIVFAFIAAPTAAVITFGLLVFVLEQFSGYALNEPWKVACAYAIYGAIVIFPLTIAVGLPLFLLFRLKRWLARRTVFIGGALLSLVYPVCIAVQNAKSPGLVTPIEYSVCLICGVVAAWVFCLIIGLDT